MNDNPFEDENSEKPKRGVSRSNAKQSPCPVCGSESFVWGRTSQSSAGYLAFKSDDHPWLMPGRELRARECQSCGNVLLFTVEPPY